VEEEEITLDDFRLVSYSVRSCVSGLTEAQPNKKAGKERPKPKPKTRTDKPNLKVRQI
jgi:hypothetical protein